MKKLNLNNNFITKLLLSLMCFALIVIGLMEVYELRHFPVEKINNNKSIMKVDEYPNSEKKLNILSAYGDHQAYHPKTLYFKDKWNGYNYWMSFTPYPYGSSNKENPHVVVSNDMINWEEIDGFKNPLDEVENTENGKRYNSDSHLVYNDDNDTLECWWRFVDDTNDTVTIYRMITENGVDWTQKEVVFKNKRSKQDYVSPAVIYEDNMYKMWFVSGNKTVYYTESEDLKNWSEYREVKIEYNESVQSWHLDVIHSDKGYEMILVAFTDWNSRNQMNLYYTSSSDNEVWNIANVILTPSTNSINWDNSGLYRSSILYIDGIYYIYYSGQSITGAKGIGLVYGSDIYNLKSVKY